MVEHALKLMVDSPKVALALKYVLGGAGMQ